VKILFQVLFILSISFFKSQEFKKVANIPDNIENEKEIRICIGSGIANSGKIFRIYLNDNKKWNSELIQWFFPKKISEDEYEVIPPIVTKLKSKISLDIAFLNLEALNIGYLPKEEFFNYKKSKKEVVFDENENEYVINSTEMGVLDGVDYKVQYQSNKRKNEFHYNNPYVYLQEYPGINEYESFIKILKYVEDNFNVKLK